jgi:6-phospho-beta-glucosidase
MKICVLGCGLRTPLLLHGLTHSDLGITEVVLYDVDFARASLMAELGMRIAEAAPTRVMASPAVEQAVEGCRFVISSIRVGDMATRAADERRALESGFAGQETTGPAGFAMALRTIPVAIQHARIVERAAPSAWIINFTNPAGIITQAISTHTGARVIGICDTPAELFFQIARALDEPLSSVECQYFGLNHLGWVRSVRVRDRDVTARLLGDERLLRILYPAELFSAAFLQALELIPTEYLFFYYNQELARRNQLLAGVTRGEELELLNRKVWADLEGYVRMGDAAAGLQAYRRYLNRRNASYMRLEGAAESAAHVLDTEWNPFEGATGYHRIAVETIRSLLRVNPACLVLNVPNRGSIQGVASEDIVEIPCMVNQSGPRPLSVGALPDSVRGLMFSVKHYERLTIQAAMEERWDVANLALSMNPIVGSWNAAANFLSRLASSDTSHFLTFKGHDILQCR